MAKSSSCDSIDRLSPEEFDTASSKLRMTNKTQSLAREVLVRGLTVTEAALKYKVSKPWVTNSCKRILSACELQPLTVDLTFQVPHSISNEIKTITKSCINIYKIAKGEKT